MSKKVTSLATGDDGLHGEVDNVLSALRSQWEVLVEGRSFPTRKAAREAFEYATRFGGLKGGSATLPGLGHVAIVLMEPTERFWSMHFDRSGCYVLGRRGPRTWEEGATHSDRGPSAPPKGDNR
jgi:hypothetical protein